jgi:hypothetical protein
MSFIPKRIKSDVNFRDNRPILSFYETDTGCVIKELSLYKIILAY